MATQTINYSSNTTITMDLANLGSSATFIAGRESTEIDNTTNKYVDCIVDGAISVGTTPTANTSINVFVWGAEVAPSTTALDGGNIDGLDSAETITNTGVLYSLFKLGAVVNVLVNTSDVAYPVAPFSIAQLFGGVVPKYWGLFVAHNTGVNLRNNAVNTNSFKFVGIKYDVA